MLTAVTVQKVWLKSRSIKNISGLGCCLIVKFYFEASDEGKSHQCVGLSSDNWLRMILWHVEMEVASTCFVNDHSRELQEQCPASKRWRLTELVRRWVFFTKFFCVVWSFVHTQTDFRSFKMELLETSSSVKIFRKLWYPVCVYTGNSFFHTRVLGLNLSDSWPQSPVYLMGVNTKGCCARALSAIHN